MRCSTASGPAAWLACIVMKIHLRASRRLGPALLVAAAGLLASALLGAASPPPYRWTTFASRASVGSDDGPVGLARFDEPRGVAYDAAGNLYVADAGNCTIRKITPAGVVSTFAGLAGQPGSVDGTGGAARFKYPDGLATDAAGNLYVADAGSYTIRKITPAGVVSTLAGQAGVAIRQDGPLATATLVSPTQVACAPNGDLYVLDGSAIRRITNGQLQTVVTSGDIVTIAGSSYPFNLGPGLAVDAAGQLLISASLQAPSPYGSSPTVNYPGIYRRDAQGNLTAVIGGLPPNNSAAIVSYGRLTVDGSGRVLALLSTQWEGEAYPLWRITPGGSSERLDNISGANGGNIPSYGVAANAAGDVCYTRDDNVIVRLPAAGGGPGVFAGTAEGDGATGFEDPASLAFDAANNLWVGDLTTWVYFGRGSSSERLVKVTPAGVRSTVIPPAYSYEVSYYTPAVAAGDAQGNVFFIHGLWRQDTLARVDPAGTVTTSALGAPGGTTRFTQLGNCATSCVIDRAGNFVFPDPYDHVIRVRSPGGAWSVLAGTEGNSGSADGSGGTAWFERVWSIAMDRAGNYFVLDANSAATRCVIRKITSAGVVTTVSANLVATAVGSGLPSGLAVDSQGVFYLTYGSAGTVWRLTSTGELDLIGGETGENGTADGTGPAARFMYPSAIAVDAQDRLYVADLAAHILRQGVLVTEAPQITVQPQSQTVNVGSIVQFSVTATGSPPPAYQWYLGGTAIAGATGDTLTITSAQPANAGTYTVKATNSVGSVTSRDAVLSVAVPPPVQPTPSGGGGGGGAPSPWFYLLLGTVGLGRWLRRHRG